MNNLISKGDSIITSYREALVTTIRLMVITLESEESYFLGRFSATDHLIMLSINFSEGTKVDLR